MKIIFVLLTLCLFSLSSMASDGVAGVAIDNPTAAITVKNKIRGAVLKFDGVAGIGVPNCDPHTGTVKKSLEPVSCVAIYVETYEAYIDLLGLYPQGTKINGVFVTVVPTGVLKADPRMTSGN